MSLVLLKVLDCRKLDLSGISIHKLPSYSTMLYLLASIVGLDMNTQLIIFKIYGRNY